MKRIIFITSLSLAALFSSCSSATESDQSIESTKNTYGIELVNNEKWQVNEQMMVHIKNMEADITFTSGQEAPNYEELRTKLDENIGLLIASCNMKGKAHDELHKWLLPFIDLVEELNEATSPEEKKKSVEALKESMNVFNTYFE